MYNLQTTRWRNPRGWLWFNFIEIELDIPNARQAFPQVGDERQIDFIEMTTVLDLEERAVQKDSRAEPASSVYFIDHSMKSLLYLQYFTN